MNWENRRDVLVFLEQREGRAVSGGLEALSAARVLAEKTGGQVLALLMGMDNAAAGEQVRLYADGVLSLEGPAFAEGCYDAFAFALAALTERRRPAAVLAGNSPLARELTARLCARQNLASAQDAAALTLREGEPVWTVPLYGGTVLQDLALDTLPQVATLRSGAFARPEAGPPAPIIRETAEVPAEAVRTQVRERVQEIAEAVNLEEAQVIVTGGRGMGSKENFALVEQLAQALGGVVGATRPAIEEGWVSRAHQVGQSGKIVAPALYIACGVSGATQHVSGMSGAGYVVAVNKDEDAAIFDIADVGIVGDVTQVLPVMLEEIARRRAR